MDYTSEQKRDNLRTLANYLAALPLDYVGFEMNDFFSVLNVSTQRSLWYNDQITKEQYDAAVEEAQDIARKYARENGGVAQCGAVACAVGHGPSAGFLLTDADFFKNTNTPDWANYTRRVFLRVCGDGYYDPIEFEWMFGGLWSEVDNTPQGAAKRIIHFLDKGVPEIFIKDGQHDPELYA